MEKRLLVFFAVTFVLITVWSRLFPPPAPPEDVARPSAEAPAEAPADTESAPPPPVDEPRATAPPVLEEAVETSIKEAEREQRVTVDTPLYEMELTNEGARILSMKLKNHVDEAGNAYEIVGQEAEKQLSISPLDVRVEGEASTIALRRARFERAGPARVDLGPGESETIVFSWSDGRGLEAQKELTFGGDDYQVDVVVSVRERGEEISKRVLFGAGIGNEVTDSRYMGVDKGVVVSRGEVLLFDVDDVQEGEGGGPSISATGVTSHYFAALMVPAGEGIYGSRLEAGTIVTEGDSPRERDVITAVLEAPREAASFGLYMGPKRLERLEALAPGLSEIIEFGSWMRYPALLLRSGLMWIHDHVGNYGWAIVLLTVVINLVLVPLKHYSFVSMRKMQKIAPQTQKIRERYKKVKPTDPRYQEMNKELMALHKEHGVNPVSGCLPMLLMIPFFFAFYRLLMASIELRHAPFVLWIDDLSAHDPFFVLPILMGITQLGIQKMTPQTSADPVQAKIMGFMPVLFTFILAWAPSGLVLYWFSNNLVSMAQQMATNRFMKDPEPKADATEGAAKKRKGKKRENKKIEKTSASKARRRA